MMTLRLVLLLAILSFPLIGAQAQESQHYNITAPIEVVLKEPLNAPAEKPLSNTAEATHTEEPATLFGDLLKKYNIQPTGSATVDYYSRYVWRGQYLDRDHVLQPGISLSANGLSVGYWSNWDMVGSDPLSSNESDYFVSYSYTTGPVTWSAGHTWYHFAGTGTSSKELFASAALNSLPLSPVISVYHDYQDGKDFGGDANSNYYSLGLSKSFDIYKPYNITLSLGATLGYIDHQWLNLRGFHFTPSAALNIPITKSFTISPTAGYNITEGDLHSKQKGNQENRAFGGIHSAISF